MPRMRAPYTGVVFDVHPDNVEKRLARGFELLETFGRIETDSEPEQDSYEPEPSKETAAESAASDAQKPTEDSTIAEIREWAAAHGVELPKKGNKAALLEAIEGAGA